MNQKLYSNICSFGYSVEEYIRMEYPVYIEYLDINNLHIFDLLGSYYLGGANVPDTARCVVEFISNNIDRFTNGR